MIIVNGTLSRIDAPAAPDVAGQVAYTLGSALDVGVTIDAPSSSQKFTLGAKIADVTAVVYIAKSDLPEGTQLREGYRVVVALEGEDPQTLIVVLRQLPTFDELTHYQLFCKAA